jgi:urease accessory protein
VPAEEPVTVEEEAPAGTTASIRFRAGIGGEPILQALDPSVNHRFEVTKWGALVVGASGHPVAGDHDGLRVDVGVGCCAEIKSQAPTVARKGRTSSPWEYGPVASSLAIQANVGTDAMLTWRPEPGIATEGCDHRCEAEVYLASNARLMWCDEFQVERRADSAPGTWRSRLRVVRDSWPVICAELALGPGSALWESPAVLEGAKAVSKVVIVDPGHPSDGWRSSRASSGTATGVALPLAAPGLKILAWGEDLADCRTVLLSIIQSSGVPVWVAERWGIYRAPGVVSAI